MALALLSDAGEANMAVGLGQLERQNNCLRRILEMLYTILVVLLVLWLLGFIGHVGGGLIHLVLVLALIIFLVNLLTGRRTA